MSKNKPQKVTGDRLVILSVDNNQADVMLDGRNVGICQRDLGSRKWSLEDHAGRGKTYEATSLYECGVKAQQVYGAKEVSFEAS